MKLYFDPIKAQSDAKRLDACVFNDMQIEELLHVFLNNKQQEQATAEILAQFCSDPAIITYRQNIIGDLIYSDELFEMFSALRENLWDLKLLYELKMFKNIPEMATMKTFLVIEKFFDIYTRFMTSAEKLSGKYSDEMNEILAKTCSKENKDAINSIENDIKGLRENLETIGEIRLNRFFSRGQNIENSITSKTDIPSLNKQLSDAAEALGVDVEAAQPTAIHSPKELTRPVFVSLYTLYYDIFKYIDAFHEKYSHIFDTAWLDLIEKLDAALGFASIFRELKEKEFYISKAKISDSTKISDFYSLFLVKRDLTPKQVVYNDFVFGKDTSFFFITGPNAGGKTIFLSATGLCQLFFQACGFVPARHADMKLMKRMFTHFPVEEYNDNSGRLVEEQGRVESIFRDIIDGECLALFNETYSSTKADVAYDMSVKLVEKVLEHNVAGLFVTHLHSLKDYAAETKSKTPNLGVLTALNDEKTGTRLYKIVPLSTQNSSFAKDILLKYDMTIEQMLDRINKKEVG